MDPQLAPHLVVLLRSINDLSTAEALLREGFTYTQIAELLFEAEDHGLLVLSRDGEQLTQAGLDFVRARTEVAESVRRARSPIDEMLVEQRQPSEVYLPPDEMSFFD